MLNKRSKYPILLLLIVTINIKSYSQKFYKYENENYNLDTFMRYSFLNYHTYFWFQNSFKNLLSDSHQNHHEFIKFGDIYMNKTYDTIIGYAMVKIASNDSLLDVYQNFFERVYFDTAKDYTKIFTHVIKIYIENEPIEYNRIFWEFIPINGNKINKKHYIVRQCFNDNFITLIYFELRTAGCIMGYR